MGILAAPFLHTTYRDLGCLHQQETQHRTPLLGDVSQPSPISAGIFQRHQSEIARYLLPTLKAIPISEDEHEGQCGQSTHTWMCHQPLRFGMALGSRLTRLA